MISILSRGVGACILGRVSNTSLRTIWTSVTLNHTSNMMNQNGTSHHMMTDSSIVIGFAGVTNGGKTTTCGRLQESLQNQGYPVTHFTMDDYYWDEDNPNHVMLPEFDCTYANWDDVCAVNWEMLKHDIEEWRDRSTTTSNGTKHKPVLLVEGIMIYNHSDLLPYFDKKYYFTLPKEECWKRRRERNYQPPEPEGYFDQIVWPFYIKLKKQIASQTDIVYLDGTMDKNESFEAIKTQVEQLLKS